MSQYDLIALLPGYHDIPERLNVRVHHVADFTIIMERECSPVLRLPQSRKVELRGAARRQSVLEQLMPIATVLPVLPRQSLRVSDAEAMILANTAYLAQLQTKLVGKVQYQLIVDWKSEGVLAQFRHSPELAPLFDAPLINPPMLERAVTALKMRLVVEIQGLLASIAKDLITLPGEAETVFSAVLLIDETATMWLDRAVEAIDDIWTEGLRIRQIGPAPAASFNSLVLENVTGSMLKDALRLFDYNSMPDLSQITTTKKRLLRQSDPAIADRIRRAADILVAGTGLAQPEQGFPMLKSWSEGTASLPDNNRQVA